MTNTQLTIIFNNNSIGDLETHFYNKVLPSIAEGLCLKLNKDSSDTLSCRSAWDEDGNLQVIIKFKDAPDRLLAHVLNSFSKSICELSYTLTNTRFAPICGSLDSSNSQTTATYQWHHG